MAGSFLYKVKKMFPFPIFAVLFVSSIGAYKMASNKKGGMLTYENIICTNIYYFELSLAYSKHSAQARGKPQETDTIDRTNLPCIHCGGLWRPRKGASFPLRVGHHKVMYFINEIEKAGSSALQQKPLISNLELLFTA